MIKRLGALSTLNDPLILALRREREPMTYRDCAILNYSAQDQKRIFD